MATFEGGKAYQYLPLPEGTILSYRIFTLYPACDLWADIQASIHICSVSYTELEGPSFERFEALSYAWGDASPTGIIEFVDGSCLPIAANLESFLRYRRQHDQPVALWIDAICINQHDHKEKSSQVQAMGIIYLLASRLNIWLGPPSNDSALAMNALLEFSYETAFSKLSSSLEQSSAIDRLINRAWWFRAWIIQEVALGGAGTKYREITVRCGLEHIKWFQLVLACSRIHANTLNMRQSFPAVKNVLRLDALASRWSDEISGADEIYPCRLLRHLSEYRSCLASDARDKIYALLGLWVDTIGVGINIGSEASDMESRPAPAVNYDHSMEEVYLNFASWILDSTQSLQVLSHCQPLIVTSTEVGGVLPTWVPDWSQALVQARLPPTNRIEGAPIPWWSLPTYDDDDDGRRSLRYLLDDQISRRKRAEEIVRPVRSSLHYIPEWVVDMMDPDGTNGAESTLKELQRRADVLFFFPDESDRALGDEKEDMWTAVSRTQDHNEKTLQRQVLSQYLHAVNRAQFSACGTNTCELSIEKRTLHVKGILCDIIQEIYDVFPEEVEKDWTNSTLLMVQIGKCKHAIMEDSVRMNPYYSEQGRLMAFWKTLFAGQQAKDEAKVASWLPLRPLDWEWTTPTLTVFESGRLENAEIRSMMDEFTKYLTRLNVDESTHTHSGFDEHLAKDDMLLDARWSLSDRLDHQRSFKELGEKWATQPYDLYHRPFSLPYVVPDPFWESRRIHDVFALKESIETRHQTTIASSEGETREIRGDVRRFMRDRIRQQPAREPQCPDDAKLVKYALGRRFFISREGYFGLAPPNSRKGDRVAVLYGADVPFVLRKVGSAFQVVGESYTHGLMEGQAVEKGRIGTKEVRSIVLV